MNPNLYSNNHHTRGNPQTRYPNIHTQRHTGGWQTHANHPNVPGLHANTNPSSQFSSHPHTTNNTVLSGHPSFGVYGQPVGSGVMFGVLPQQQSSQLSQQAGMGPMTGTGWTGMGLSGTQYTHSNYSEMGMLHPARAHPASLSQQFLQIPQPSNQSDNFAQHSTSKPNLTHAAGYASTGTLLPSRGFCESPDPCHSLGVTTNGDWRHVEPRRDLEPNHDIEPSRDTMPVPRCPYTVEDLLKVDKLVLDNSREYQVIYMENLEWNRARRLAVRLRIAGEFPHNMSEECKELLATQKGANPASRVSLRMAADWLKRKDKQCEASNADRLGEQVGPRRATAPGNTGTAVGPGNTDSDSVRGRGRGRRGGRRGRG